MKIVIKIFSICVLAGCNSARVANSKSYVFTSSNSDHVLHRLELFGDQTFAYKITGDLNEAASSGSWSVEENRLYLNSFNEYKTGYYKINNIKSANAINDRFNVYVVDNDGVPLEEALVFYGNDSFRLRQDGVVSLRKGLDTTIRISFLGINYQASLKGFNKREDIKIEIIPLDSRKLYLNDEVWKVRRNRVINPLNKKLVR